MNDKANRILTDLGNAVRLARRDVADMTTTADRHPCTDCEQVLRNKIIRRDALAEALQIATATR